MKTFMLTILLIFVISANNHAQETGVFPTDSASWKLYYLCYDGGNPYYASRTIEIIGDTVLNEKNYIVLDESWGLFFARVEDNKVYFKHPAFPDGNEHLFYDFNLEVGDVFHYPNSLYLYQDSVIIEAIDTISLLDGSNRRRLKLATTYQNICGPMDYWVEEIGSTLIPFYFMDCFECGLRGYTYTRNNELLYSNTPVNLEETSEQLQVKVYPNPSKFSFTLEFESGKFTDIRLINLMGQEVFQKSTIENNVEIHIPSNIPKGIYL
ncbi:MAG: T9SS C-terminal target domain-containing protein, partial [Bacteroidetes bacterium]